MAPQTPVTLRSLRQMKQAGEKIAALTAYDAAFARLIEAAGVEVALIGDSLGMALQGREDTLSVSMDEMVYHTRMVTRACKRALTVADMPFRSYETAAAANNNAKRLVDEGGAAVVKLEGGVEVAEIVASLVSRDIPVCGHVGLQPQSIRQYGGYKVQGRTAAEAEAIVAGAAALEAAGAGMIVLECIPRQLAARVTQSVSIPTIGIGAGVDCDGQVLVLYDALGISGRSPRMAKNYLRPAGGIGEALERYVGEVKRGDFPDREHSYE